MSQDNTLLYEKIVLGKMDGKSLLKHLKNKIYIAKDAEKDCKYGCQGFGGWIENQRFPCPCRVQLVDNYKQKSRIQ